MELFPSSDPDDEIGRKFLTEDVCHQQIIRITSFAATFIMTRWSPNRFCISRNILLLLKITLYLFHLIFICHQFFGSFLANIIKNKLGLLLKWPYFSLSSDASGSLICGRSVWVFKFSRINLYIKIAFIITHLFYVVYPF